MGTAEEVGLVDAAGPVEITTPISAIGALPQRETSKQNGRRKVYALFCGSCALHHFAVTRHQLFREKKWFSRFAIYFASPKVHNTSILRHCFTPQFEAGSAHNRSL